jgi:hypothetical protein
MTRSLDESSSRSERNEDERERQETSRKQPETRIQENKSIYHFCGHNYHLNPKQAEMLLNIGAFRVVTTYSLEKHIYKADPDRFKNDVRSLAEQRLVISQPDSRSKGRYIALTRSGKSITEVYLRTNTAQSLYSGIVKKRELRHDAAIYEMYQKEAQKISKSGGTLKRVVLDFELKKQVNRQLAKIQNFPAAERQLQRQQIAESHGLKIINNKIQIPDLRLEYESREHEESKVDLECVTGHYKARQIAVKRSAGFTLYNQDYRGRPAERGEELIGEVISI